VGAALGQVGPSGRCRKRTRSTQRAPASSRIGLAGGVDCCLLGDELFAPSCSHFGPQPLQLRPNRCSPVAVASAAARPVPGRPTPGQQPPAAAESTAVGAGSSRPRWGQAARNTKLDSPLLSRLHCGKRLRVMGFRSAWGQPLRPEQARAVAFAGPRRIRRVLLQVQPAPAAAVEDSPRSSPSSRPQGSRRPRKRRLEAGTNSNARADHLRYRLAPEVRHGRTP